MRLKPDLRSAAALFAIALAAAVAVSGCTGGSKKTASSTASPAVDTTAAAEPVTPRTVVVPAIETQPGLTTPQIVAKLAPSLVRVQTSTATLDIFGRTVPSTGVGTGVIIDNDGHIVTNNHVVTNDTGTTPAGTITVTLADQTTLPATIVGRDQPTDLAVLKVDAPNLSPAKFASADSLVVGQDVVAMGFALDLKGGPTVTRGVLSAKGREINEQQYTINDALQTDAGINPGNSGGPLVNAEGEVIGINTAIIQSAQNIGFAISVGLVDPTVKALIETGRVDRAYLGVGTVDVTPAIARNFNLPVDHGIAVTVVGSGTPAEAAGLQENDVIVKVDGQDVPNNGKLLSILANHRAGDVVKVEFYSGGDLRTADVTLASRPGG
jgi:serine protease Do